MPNEDPLDALLARFKALSTPVEVVVPKETEELKGDEHPGSDGVGDGKEISDEDVEAYLNAFPTLSSDPDLSPSTPLPPPTATNELEDLLRSSRALSKEASDFLPADDSDSSKQDEQAEAEEDDDLFSESAILQRALDEAALDPPTPPLAPSPPTSLQTPSTQAISGIDHLSLLSSLSSPSLIADSDPPDPLASLFPTLPKNLSDFLMPSVPTGNPKGTGEDEEMARFRGKKFGLEGWDEGRDDDITSWCCICNADATLVCLSCGSDPYCAECWKEGHGPEDGKEKGHKIKKFEKGR